MEKAAVSKADWFEKIARELKNRPLAELDREVAAGVRVSPFAHADDFPAGRPAPIFFEKASRNDWQIAEKIAADDPKAANQKALAALAGGAEAIDFAFENLPADEADFAQFFDGVFADMIATTFSGAAVRRSSSAFLGFFSRLAEGKKWDSKSLRGSLDFDPAGDLGERPDWRFLADLLAFSAEKLPFFHFVSLETDELDAAKSLAELLKKTNLIAQKLTEKGATASQIFAATRLKISIGPDFLTEISRLRAMQILWLNLQKGWGLEVLSAAPITVVFAEKSYADDPNQNMIRATEMAVAAAVGGAERVRVRPFQIEKDARETDDFYRRIARNVGHILKSESFLGRVEDPAAGSFFIENLTEKLARAAWADFQNG